MQLASSYKSKRSGFLLTRPLLVTLVEPDGRESPADDRPAGGGRSAAFG